MPALYGLAGSRVVEREHAQVAHVTGGERDGAEGLRFATSECRGVEARVGLDERVGVVGALGALGFLEGGGDAGEAFSPGADRATCASAAGSGMPHQLVDLVDVGVGQHRDGEAASVGGDEPLALKTGEGLPHGRARDAQLDRERRFLQPLARDDHVAAQVLAQRPVDPGRRGLRDGRRA